MIRVQEGRSQHTQAATQQVKKAKLLYVAGDGAEPDLAE
jgi:hypothetical protein